PPQRVPPVLRRLLPPLAPPAALQHHAPQRARQGHDLVQPLAPLVPRAAAGVAAAALVERQLLRVGRRDAERLELLLGILVLLLALRADTPDQPLCNDQVHDARSVVRLCAHVPPDFYRPRRF